MHEAVSPFQLRLPGFEGSLTEFLRLASERRIDVESMLVAGVTSQLARYVAEANYLDLDCAADALAAASRLLALKSGRLLSQETERPEDRISIIKERDPLIASEQMRRYAAELRLLEGRESFASSTPPHLVDRRLEPRNPEILTRAWSAMRQRSIDAAGQVALPSFLELEAAISDLIRTLRTRSRLSFRLLTNRASRNDAVVHFQAVLELCQRRKVTALQSEPFGDIMIVQEEYVVDADTASRAG